MGTLNAKALDCKTTACALATYLLSKALNFAHGKSDKLFLGLLAKFENWMQFIFKIFGMYQVAKRLEETLCLDSWLFLARLLHDFLHFFDLM